MFAVDKYFLRFDVLTAVFIKSAVFWDTCRFGGTYRLHLQGRINQARYQLEISGYIESRREREE
jgi:hypothetical protein